MLPHSWLPFCTSFSCFQGGNKHDSTVVSWSTDPWDSNYLTDRGYSLWTEDDEWKVFSLRFHYLDKYPVVQLSIDTDYQGADWETFSNSHYFQAVSKMMPGVEIGRIDVRRQQVEVWHHGYPPIDVECMTFWFKQPVSEDDDASMDPIAKNLKFYNEERSFYHRIVPCKTTCF
ncbi:hypothetical protein HOO65_010149 [Ceratocystis lukuohia]|uniref:Uncharacterized protein n=1 Tax=Ceratocystis lukuohia TaxID=2019550 RepID=A0ABR4MR89_9PEZI